MLMFRAVTTHFSEPVGSIYHNLWYLTGELRILCHVFSLPGESKMLMVNHLINHKATFVLSMSSCWPIDI